MAIAADRSRRDCAKKNEDEPPFFFHPNPGGTRPIVRTKFELNILTDAPRIVVVRSVNTVSFTTRGRFCLQLRQEDSSSSRPKLCFSWLARMSPHPGFTAEGLITAARVCSRTIVILETSESVRGGHSYRRRYVANRRWRSSGRGNDLIVLVLRRSSVPLRQVDARARKRISARSSRTNAMFAKVAGLT